MVGFIIFGGISSLDYGAVVDGTETYAAPERDCETVEIPGKNGALTLDCGRYKNTSVPYYMIFKHTPFMEAYRDAVMAVSGYQRLEDSHHPDEYRLARLTGGFEPTLHGVHNRYAEVTVTFDCKPQRFLKDGELPLAFTKTTPLALTNPTGQTALPLIRVWGTGTLGIGDCTLEIGAHGKEYLDIDCDLQDCFFGIENLNSFVTLHTDFPSLPAGATGISLTGITKIEITPRWWAL